MFYYLSYFRDSYGPLRLFEYTTFRAGGALLTAMLICLFCGPLTVRLLKRFRAQAPGRLDGLVPDEFIDRDKDKTPSMGGLLIVFSITVSTLLWTVISNPLVMVFLVTLLAYAAVGFVDDYIKVAYRNRDGISARLKLIFQVLIAAVAILFLNKLPETGSRFGELIVPFVSHPVLLSSSTVLVLAFCVFVVVGSSNAVNLTDGKDGLAVGCTIFCSLTYGMIAYLCGHKIFAGYLNIPFISGASEVVVLTAAISGACIGFLWHNCHPASMFMGDTGSLALGGTIGLIAVLVKQEVALVIIGGVFVMEALSVIIQIAGFKLTGKRVFLCAPIHHHFERKGWTETQIVVRFWILAGIFALLGLATLKLR
ncbi:MAG: phospho-N-acetylmuramoyl-pentapeptide-transferase [Victivallales bacterium]|nr:phospho-N-acetylmuramoyl-pentapeptide-transferase [Victivallales bacterium]